MKASEGIILAFSNTRDDNLKHLNPELQKIRDVLKDAEEKNYLHIIEHNGVTYNSLSYLLNSGKGKEVTMLHFSGHSSKNGLLVQSHDELGIISKKPLTNLIKAHKRFRLVFLNSCYSRDIAQELIDAGVPYVIGTTDKVNDEQSAIVAAKFYSLLAKWGKTIEEAFLLTKDYIDDPLNDKDTNIKEAFRTFAILDDNKNEYPWQLYQSDGLNAKDKNWVLNPERPIGRRKKWHIGLGALVAIAMLIYAVFGINKYKANKNNDGQAQMKDTSAKYRNPDSLIKSDTPVGKLPKPTSDGSGADKKKTNVPDKNFHVTTVSVDSNVGPGLLKPPGKKLFAQLKIVNSGNQYDNSVTIKVRNIFSEKGYVLEEAGANLPAKNYENLISGELTLSQPVKTDGPSSTVVVNYIVGLTLRFSDGAGRQICGQRDYSKKVSTTESDTKERVLNQGLNDVLDQLQNDNNFPFCIKK